MKRAISRPPLFRIERLSTTRREEAHYPFTVPTIRSMEALDVRARVLFFVGENGSGKSTLLEALALACGFGIEGGTRNLRFSTRAPDLEREGTADPIGSLADALRLSWSGRHQRDGFFLRAESFFNVATEIDRGDHNSNYGSKSLHDRSHGESFLTLFFERFSKAGLFLLDEPEAALSVSRQLAMLVRMNDLLAADERTQFIIATHSPILLAFPDAQIVSFDGARLRDIDYRETDAYALTRRFLTDPKRAVATLFRDEDGVSIDDDVEPGGA